MKILDKIFGKKDQVKQIDTVLNEVTLGNFISGQPILTNTQYIDAYGKYIWVYSCIRAIACAIASLPLRVYNIKTGDDATQDDKFKVLQKPNNDLSEYDLWESLSSSIELTGEFFCEIVRNGGKKIIELWPLRSDYMTVEKGKKSLIGGYVYGASGRQLKLTPEDVLYFKTYNPTNDLRGLSTLSAAADTLNTDKEAIGWNYQSIKSGVKPSGVLEMPPDAYLSKDAYERLKQQFDAKYAGSNGANRALLLEGGLTFKPLSISQKDAEYLNQRKWGRDEILAIFGVPPAVVGIFETAIRANAREQKSFFWSNTIKNRTRKIEEFFNKPDNGFIAALAGSNDYACYFDYSNIEELQDSIKTKIDAMALVFDKGGVTPNEIREILGLNPLEGDSGDQTFISFNIIPYANVEKEEMKSARKVFTYTEEQKTAIWKRFNLEVSKFERVMRKDFSNLLKQQNDEVIDSLIKNSDPEKIDPSKLFDSNKWEKKFAEADSRHAGKIIDNAGQMAESLIGKSYNNQKLFDPESPAIEAYKKKRVKYFADEVNKTLAEELDRAIPAVIEEIGAGVTIADIAAKTEAMLDNIVDYRAARMARTEATVFHNYGSMEAYKQNDVPKHLWLTQRDDRVRDEHAELDGTVVAIGEPFPGYDDGTDSAFPSSVNERCTTIPYD